MKKRTIWIATAVLYAALLTVTWSIETQQARKKTEALLDYAVLDMRDSIGGALDTTLGYVGVTVIRRLGAPRAQTLDEMRRLADELRVDEINVVDRTGRILASNDSEVLGGSMLSKAESAAFQILTNGTTKTFSQVFRAGALNPGVRRKYLGVAFPNGVGYVQVGYDERRLERMLPILLGFIYDEWLVGETGFLLCADQTTGRLISNPSRHRDEAKTLAETGFDGTAAPGAGKPLPRVEALEASETFVQTVFGQRSFCRSYVFGGHRLIAVVPEIEFYDSRNLSVAVMAALLAFVLGGFAAFLVRIAEDSAKMRAFYAAEDAARARDMEIAATIQTSALPPGLPDDPRVRLAAAMTPARDVGGDFYDFFFLDATHLAVLVADVSGKGITAALYMMTAKTLIKDTLLAGHDVAAAFAKVNADLSRNNPANMFLTAWMGVLDLDTGRVTFVNAGHNPPAVRHADGTVTWRSEKSGLMLAFMDGVDYRPYTLTLNAGDTLFLYTDGVTEAMDAKGELFGDGRLMETLGVAPSGEPERICALVRTAVAAFAAGMPPADDLTVLAVQYLVAPRQPVPSSSAPSSGRTVQSFPATQTGLAAAMAVLDAQVADVPDDVHAALNVILDEIVSNIVAHAGASAFEMTVTRTAQGVELVFSDDGRPYDPLARTDPDTSLDAAARPIGGLGILMVKKMASSLAYARVHERNVLTIVKNV